MVMRFDLSDSLEEFYDVEDTQEPPCFPYPEQDERPGGIDMWLPLPARHPVRLTLKIRGKQANLERGVGHKERKVLLRLSLRGCELWN